MEYYSAIKRNAFESVLVRWTNLESIIHSEISQKEKYKYCTLMHIYGIQKDRTYFQGSNGEPDIENRPKNAGGGEEGEGEMYGESNMETYITICKIDSQWEFAV